jgi:enoyl-CoA hydratase
VPNSADTVICEISDRVATVTLNRPDALNALTPAMLVRLGDVLEQLAGDGSVAVVVLTGAGRAFSAGVDLKALAGHPITAGGVGDLLDVPARRVTGALATMPKVTIAKVNGFCFTGALELAISCDIVVIAEEAKLGDTHVKFGLRPTWGMSQRLIRLVGPARARELSFTARTFTGADAAAWGLAARAVPRDRIDDAVAALVDEVLGNSADALAAYKDLFRAALDHGLTDGLAYEAATRYPIADSEERVAGFR